LVRSHSFNKELKINSFSNGNQKLKIPVDYYNKYKTEFGIEQYLLNIKNDKLRKQLTRFRLSAHKLAIGVGRFQNIDREQRLCTFCNQHQIETEFHFLLICPKYIEIRKLFIINYTSFPTLTRFNKIMSSKNAKSQLNLAKFIDKAMNVRKSIIDLPN